MSEPCVYCHLHMVQCTTRPSAAPAAWRINSLAHCKQTLPIRNNTLTLQGIRSTETAEHPNHATRNRVANPASTTGPSLTHGRRLKDYRQRDILNVPCCLRGPTKAVQLPLRYGLATPCMHGLAARAVPNAVKPCLTPKEVG